MMYPNSSERPNTLTTLTDDEFEDRMRRHREYLSGGYGRISFNDCNLRGRFFGGRNLAGLRFERADLQYVDLSESNLNGAVFAGANLSGANFSGSNLSGASLYRVTAPSTLFRKADLTEADLRYSSFGAAAFDYANLSGALLENTDLEASNLYGAKLRGAKFRNTNLFSVQWGTSRVIQVGPVGGRGDTLVVVYGEEESEWFCEVKTGCFSGDLDEFEIAVRYTHGENINGQEYQAVIAMLRTVMGLNREGW